MCAVCSCICSLISSFTLSLNQLLIHFFLHLVTHSLSCSLVNLFIQSLPQSLAHSFIRPSARLFIHSFPVPSFICLLGSPPPGADFQGTGIGLSILPFLFFISEVVVWLRSSTLCAGCFPGSRDITSNDCTLTFISILCQDNSSSFPFYLSHFSGFQLAQT